MRSASRQSTPLADVDDAFLFFPLVRNFTKSTHNSKRKRGHRGAVPVVYEAYPHPARGWELRLSPVDLANTTPRSERLALLSKSFQARSATQRVPSLSFWKRSFVSSRAFPFLPGWWCQPSPPSLGCAWLKLILIFCLSCSYRVHSNSFFFNIFCFHLLCDWLFHWFSMI